MDSQQFRSSLSLDVRDEDMKEISIESWDMFVEHVETLQAERDTYDKQTSLIGPGIALPWSA